MMLMFFYANFYYFIPKFYARKKHLVYALILGAGLFCISIAPSLLTQQRPWQPPSNELSPQFQRPRFGPRHDAFQGRKEIRESAFFVQMKHSIYLYISVVLFSVLLRTRTQLLQTEKLKHEAEVETLRSQINPHFLFNTLNNIYSLAIRESARATASTILKLSAMMRYVVTETTASLVSLEKEIAYISDYIDLQKMRTTMNLDLKWQVTGTVESQRIAPMVLIPFVENAFKYGVNPDQPSVISISLDIKISSIYLKVYNKKVKVRAERDESGGIGLSNTRARLDLLYPGKYVLVVNESGDDYEINLTIPV